MAEAITDEYVIRVLRPVVRATRPVLDALREADPFGLRHRMAGGAGTGRMPKRLKNRVLALVANRRLPGTAAWASMNEDARCDWWANRVSRFVALVAAVPGFGGWWADRLPVGDALGAAGQGLLMCAIAGEYGVRDENDQIRLLAHVLLRRDVSAELASRSQPAGDAERQTAELTAELGASASQHGGRPTIRAIVGTVWRLGRALWSLGDELDMRPQGRFYHRGLGMVPVFGVVGDYFGERHGLRTAAKASRTWILEHRTRTRGM